MTQVGSTNNELELTSSSPLDYRVAQADVWVSAHRARDFAEQYIGPALDPAVIHLWVNLDGSDWPLQRNCDARIYFTYRIAMFTIAGTEGGIDCWNMGSHSIVPHEIGHQVHFDLGVTEWPEMAPFMEGYADSFANFTNDDVVQGRYLFIGPNGPMHIRDDPTDSSINCQYPITSSSPATCWCGSAGEHGGGQLLSGPWVRIISGFRDEYGHEDGFHRARQLFGAWSNVMLGVEDGCNGANEDVLIEVLGVAAGNDGMNIVCPAFNAHNIDTPTCN